MTLTITVNNLTVLEGSPWAKTGWPEDTETRATQYGGRWAKTAWTEDTRFTAHTSSHKLMKVGF